MKKLTLLEAFKLVKKDREDLKGKLNEISFNFLVKGEGVLNNQGNNWGTNFRMENNNITTPKVSNPPTAKKFTKEGEEKEFSTVFKVENPEFGDAKLMISSECFKNGMYKKENWGLLNSEDPFDLLCSSQGMLNGFVFTKNNNSISRTSPVFLSNLLTDFIPNEEEKEVFEKHNISIENNGKLKVEQGSKEGEAKTLNKNKEEKSTSFYFKIKNYQPENIYKGMGLFDLSKLQFIPALGKLGRDSLGKNLSIEDLAEKAKLIEQFLSILIEDDVLNIEYFENEKLDLLLKEVKENKGEIKVDYGMFRQKGGKEQLISPSLCEAGLLLNDYAQKLLLLKYFDLLLNTKIVKNNAKLKVIKLNIEADLNKPFIQFYEKVSNKIEG